MNDQEKQSIVAVLQAALHNQKMVQDQLRSLYNPKDKSFPDYDMRETAKQVQEAVEAIESAIKDVQNG